jgi:hypothetical protein
MRGAVGTPTDIEPLSKKDWKDLNMRKIYLAKRAKRRKKKVGLKDLSFPTDPILVKKV